MRKQTYIKQIQSIQHYTAGYPEIQKLFRSGKRPTEFGNKLWACSNVLIDYLHENDMELRGKRVLEIGCGWGLLGIYLAKEFDCQVTCSDLDRHVLPVVELQAELNEVQVQSKEAGFSDLLLNENEQYDIIIGVEICYSEEVVKDIIELTERAFTLGVERFMLTDPGRPDYSDYEAWSLKKYRGKTYTLPGSVNGKITTLLELRS